MSDVIEAGRTWPDHHPELSPLLPFVLSVWMDGVLSPAEVEGVRVLLEAPGSLGPDARAALGEWLDPSRPPTPAEIQDLGARIRAADIGDAEGATASVTDLGIALWKADGAPDTCWSDPDAVERLRTFEASLDLLGAEAARRMTGRPPPPETDGQETADVDAEAARRYLDRDHGDLRQEVLELLRGGELSIPIGLPYDEYRERVMDAVRLLAERGYGRLGYPVEHGGAGDAGAAVAVFETLGFGDLSVLVKFGVQFGLFGGSVHQLGTAGHHTAYLKRIGSLALSGCYAMTETGHGSNVRDLETTATYDGDADELVIHSPSEAAGKDWIGNAARHGEFATVFARLLVAKRDHGVHAILVPIRSAKGEAMPGVRIEDRGLKLGLNGVDNGRLWFDQVRVPRENLLDRFASITPDGTYESPIASSGRRFFTMLRTLVAGRVSIASASVSATKLGLTIAIRYAGDRRQFGPKSSPERPILAYPLVQRALLPRLATTMSLHFAVRELQTMHAEANPEDEAELEVRAAGLKAYASNHCVETLQACREACGGQGYLAENAFAALKADTDIFTTFEGANDVLYQLVSKGLLSRFRDQMGDLNLWRALRYLGERAETTLGELNPVAKRRTDVDHLMDPEFHRHALGYREERLLRSAAQRMRARLQDGMDSFDAVTEVQDHLVTLSRAHVERVVLDAVLAGVDGAPSELGGTLRDLAALYALSCIERDRGWFLESGYIEPNKSRAVRARVGSLCSEISDSAPILCDLFGIPEELLPPLVRRSS